MTSKGNAQLRAKTWRCEKGLGPVNEVKTPHRKWVTSYELQKGRDRGEKLSSRNNHSAASVASGSRGLRDRHRVFCLLCLLT